MKQIMVTKIGSLRDPDPAKRGAVEVRDVPDPVCGDEHVKIKVAYCSICGSDPHLVEGIFGWDPPFGIGHELSGIVVEVGKNATKKGFKPGDRVAGNFLHFCGTCYYCRNGQEQFCEYKEDSNFPGMSEYVIWHEAQAIRLPDDVSLKTGCLLEPVSVAVRMMDKLQPKIGMRVAVSGGGPIGLLALQSIKMMGAAKLTMIEPIAERRELAKKFGAEFTVDPTKEDVVKTAMEITDGLGYDIVIDASGSVHAVRALPEITAKCGTLLYGAMYPGDYEMPFNIQKICYTNEITVTGINVSPYAFPRAAQIMPRMRLEDFTDTVFDISDAKAAFEAQISGKHPKVLIRCNNIEGE